MSDSTSNEKKLVDFIVDEFGRYQKACKDRFDGLRRFMTIGAIKRLNGHLTGRTLSTFP